MQSVAWYIALIASVSASTGQASELRDSSPWAMVAPRPYHCQGRAMVCQPYASLSGFSQATGPYQNVQCPQPLKTQVASCRSFVYKFFLSSSLCNCPHDATISTPVPDHGDNGIVTIPVLTMIMPPSLPMSLTMTMLSIPLTWLQLHYHLRPCP